MGHMDTIRYFLIYSGLPLLSILSRIFRTACQQQGTFSFNYPPYTGMTLPDYIPEAIRRDYMEACSILGCKSKSICHIIASLPARNGSGFLGA